MSEPHPDAQKVKEPQLPTASREQTRLLLLEMCQIQERLRALAERLSHLAPEGEQDQSGGPAPR